eukprot:SAG31_NODE_2307_length_5969_cov_21.904940_3_plen_181_part_00
MIQVQRRQTYSEAHASPTLRDKKCSTFVVHAVGPDHRAKKPSLFVGKDDGAIIAWTMESNSVNDKPWANFFLKKGCSIKSMAYLADYSVLVTGSADGAMTIWDPWRLARSGEDGDAGAFHLLQQMVGHTSSVTALSYQDDCIVSCSTDSTVKFWKVDEGRELIQHPWFKCVQTIKLGTQA